MPGYSHVRGHKASCGAAGSVSGDRPAALPFLLSPAFVRPAPGEHGAACRRPTGCVRFVPLLHPRSASARRHPLPPSIPAYPEPASHGAGASGSSSAGPLRCGTCRGAPRRRPGRRAAGVVPRGAPAGQDGRHGRRRVNHSPGTGEVRPAPPCGCDTCPATRRKSWRTACLLCWQRWRATLALSGVPAGTNRARLRAACSPARTSGPASRNTPCPSSTSVRRAGHRPRSRTVRRGACCRVRIVVRMPRCRGEKPHGSTWRHRPVRRFLS